MIKNKALHSGKNLQITQLSLDFNETTNFVDITERIQGLLSNSSMKNGIVSIYSQHTTAGIRINENEQYLIEDFKNYLKKLIPEENYNHDNFEIRKCPPDERINARAHIGNLLFGSSESVPFADGKLLLGHWQSIFFVDLDGDREGSRQVIITILGE